MHFSQVIKRALLGISFPQEYICLGLETLDSPMSVYLTGPGPPNVIDVTASQIFIGYKPLIMAVTLDSSADLKWLRQQDRVCLSFTGGGFKANTTWKGFASDSNALARLLIRRINAQELGDSVVFIFEGEYAEHRFLSFLHQGLNRFVKKLKRQKPTNINLPGNLYDQVRIAYSMPRIISIITVLDGDKMNMFPTDLHGKVNEKYYISSLRIGGKANEQVERAGTIALSNVTAADFKNVYAMGKNHMAEVQSLENFALAPVRSRVNQIPLPESVLQYRELRRTHYFDWGIHRIHFYEILNREQIHEGVTLAHVHCYYAQWRLDNGVFTKILFR